MTVQKAQKKATKIKLVQKLHILFRSRSMQNQIKNWFKKIYHSWFSKHRQILEDIVTITTVIGIASTFFISMNTAFNVKTISDKLQQVEQELKTNDAEDTLKEYFFDIEKGDLPSAWNLLSEKKKEQQINGFIGFKDWLKNFISFDGLTIKELPDKESISTKVFITEFDFKQRGMKPVHSIWGVYLNYNGDKWEINYTNTLYENGWKPGACDFYNGFDICKELK